ncbi:18318_t:CDS:2, partial [Gigaspora rosea]
IVDELNTPIGPISQNTKVTVTWTLLPDKDANNKYGQLSATNLYKTDVTIIDSKSYTWEVSLQAGEYILGLDDGTELKQSGEVE